MQINGMREFLSKITSQHGASNMRNGGAIPALMQRNQQNHDSFSLSDISRRLCLNVGKPSSLMKGEGMNPVDSLPPEVERVDKAMAKMVDIMERMRELAIFARDKEHLSDLDRVEAQIEIEDLRAHVMAITRSLRTGVVDLSPYHAGTCLLGDTLFGDGTNILERMRERIRNGEEWNVMEVWSPYDVAWKVVDDGKVWTQDEGKTVNSGRKVPTVREVLDQMTHVVVMDAESASKGVDFLDWQVASIQEWREQLLKNFSTHTNVVEEGWNFLIHKTLVGEQIGTGLIEPTIAQYFFLGDKICDSPYVPNRIEMHDDNVSLDSWGMSRNNLNPV